MSNCTKFFPAQRTEKTELLEFITPFEVEKFFWKADSLIMR